MKVCIECGVSIVIPDSSGEYYEKNDVNGILNYSILKRYKYLDKSEKVEVTINEIRRCDYIIAMRFHVIVVSAILGVIPIPIIYHPKVRELVKELQIEEISVEMYELEDIPYKIDFVKKNREIIISKIKANVERLKEQSGKMYNDIYNYLGV